MSQKTLRVQVVRGEGHGESQGCRVPCLLRLDARRVYFGGHGLCCALSSTPSGPHAQGVGRRRRRRPLAHRRRHSPAGVHALLPDEPVRCVVTVPGARQEQLETGDARVDKARRRGCGGAWCPRCPSVLLLLRAGQFSYPRCCVCHSCMRRRRTGARSSTLSTRWVHTRAAVARAAIPGPSLFAPRWAGAAGSALPLSALHGAYSQHPCCTAPSLRPAGRHAARAARGAARPPAGRGRPGGRRRGGPARGGCWARSSGWQVGGWAAADCACGPWGPDVQLPARAHSLAPLTASPPHAQPSALAVSSMASAPPQLSPPLPHHSFMASVPPQLSPPCGRRCWSAARARWWRCRSARAGGSWARWSWWSSTAPCPTPRSDQLPAGRARHWQALQARVGSVRPAAPIAAAALKRTPCYGDPSWYASTPSGFPSRLVAARAARRCLLITRPAACGAHPQQAGASLSVYKSEVMGSQNTCNGIQSQNGAVAAAAHAAATAGVASTRRVSRPSHVPSPS